MLEKIKQYWLILLIGCIFGFVIGVTTIVMLGDSSSKYSYDIAKLIFSGGVFLTVCVALVQLRQNHIKNQADRLWNKKYLALTQMNSIVKELEEKRATIDEIAVKKSLIKNEEGKAISFSDRRAIETPLRFSEVHQWICKKDDDGKSLEKVANDNDMCAMTEDGAIIIRSLISIINTYETIAIGIKQEILDKDVILNGLKSSIIKNYKFMEEYINHKRDKHKDTMFATEWEALYNNIK